MSEATAPLLSFCIPTYKRAALLAGALDSVLAQMPGAATGRPAVEIVISDNASPDDTGEVVRRIQEAHPAVSVRYGRQQTNVGADANILAALNDGQGDFLLLFSDDDILLPGALAALLAALAGETAPDVLGLNSASFLTDSAVLRVVSLPLSADQTFNSPGECLRLFGAGITFLSAFAVRRSLLVGRDYAPYIGSNLLQSYVFLDALAAARSIRVLARPVVGVRENNSGGYNYFEVFVTNFLSTLDHAVRAGIARADVSATRTEHLRRVLFPFVLSTRLGGASPAPDFRDGARRMLKAYGPQPFSLGVLVPLLLVPGSVLRAARRVYLRLRPNKAGTDAGSLGVNTL